MVKHNCWSVKGYDARRKGGSSTVSSKKSPPVSQSAEGFRRGCFRSKYKGFPNFLLLSVRFQCFSNLLLHCQIKTPFGPNLPLTEKRGFFDGGGLFFFRTTFLASVIFKETICIKIRNKKSV